MQNLLTICCCILAFCFLLERLRLRLVGLRLFCPCALCIGVNIATELLASSSDPPRPPRPQPADCSAARRGFNAVNVVYGHSVFAWTRTQMQLGVKVHDNLAGGAARPFVRTAAGRTKCVPICAKGKFVNAFDGFCLKQTSGYFWDLG